MKITRFVQLLTAACLLAVTAIPSYAQEIKPVKELPATSVKNQANSGTCWSFAMVSMIESELLRLGKGEYDLSEMYFIRRTYPVKADRYVRLQGHTNFSGGGQGHDIWDAWVLGGVMPEEAFDGLPDKEKSHDHMEMDAVLSAFIKTVVDASIERPDKHWKAAIDSIMDIYLGRVPEKFEYNGKSYDAGSFSASLGLDPSNYIEITSFTHHPFYSTFVLEVPDNWSSGIYYNVPLDELIQIMDHSIKMGYTFAWDGDVSGKGRFGGEKAIAVLEDESKTVSQEARQLAFDNFTTTDDHLMHMTGLGQDEDGTKYFLTKNSWGDNKGMKGYWWLSENFVRMNTICVLVHKNAIPDDIAAKLKLR